MCKFHVCFFIHPAIHWIGPDRTCESHDKLTQLMCSCLVGKSSHICIFSIFMIVFMIASEYVHICDSICIMFGEHSGVCVTFGVSCRDEFYKAHSQLLVEHAMTELYKLSSKYQTPFDSSQERQCCAFSSSDLQ